MDIITKGYNINKAIQNGKVTEFKKVTDDARMYTFEENDKKYLFKPVSVNGMGQPDLEYCYKEILVSYVARYLKISSVSAHLGKYKQKFKRYETYGTILEDYNKKGYRSYLGPYFLSFFYDYLKENNKLEDYEFSNLNKEDALVKMNNLKTINDALTYYLKVNKYEDYDEIVNDIMYEFSKRFCFDYLTMQSDRHIENWALLETSDKRITLSKMFDNELAFEPDFSMQMKVFNNDETNEDILVNFLSLSDEYRDMFMSMYQRLTPEVFEITINQMEIEEGTLPSVLFRNNLVNIYTEHYENIRKIIKKHDLGGVSSAR